MNDSAAQPSEKSDNPLSHLDEQLPKVIQSKTFRQKLAIACGLGFAVLLIAMIPALIIDFYNQQQLSAKASSRDSEISRQRDEYQALLDEQSKRVNNNPTPEPTPDIRALGSQKVVLILTRPNTLSAGAVSGLLNILESNQTGIYSSCITCTKMTSFKYIKTFIEAEAKRYGIKDLSIAVETHGIYPVAALTKVGDMANLWEKDDFGTLKLQDQFEKLITEHDIKIDETARVLYVYFDPYLNSPNNSDRFYDHKTFRSYAQPEIKRAFVNAYSLEPDFSSKLVSIITHELLHLYGATDKYEESLSVKRICSVKGRGDLDLKPEVPQTTSDIMCGYIELENDKFKRGEFADNQLTINQLTAKEIGWKE